MVVVTDGEKGVPDRHARRGRDVGDTSRGVLGHVLVHVVHPSRECPCVLVVEQPKDLIALEETRMYNGLYHVLMGRLSPLDGVGPTDLTIDRLLARIDHPDTNPGQIEVEEVILGLNPTVEGDGTGLYLAEQLKTRGVVVSRLARGLPTGGSLEYANKAVLADAIAGRRAME